MHDVHNPTSANPGLNLYEGSAIDTAVELATRHGVDAVYVLLADGSTHRIDLGELGVAVLTGHGDEPLRSLVLSDGLPPAVGEPSP